MSTAKHLPSIEILKEQIIQYSRTSRQYEALYADSNEHARAGCLNYMPLHGSISAVFPYYYELKSCDSHLLLYTQSGQGRLTLGDKRILLTAGTLLFLRCDHDQILELYESNNWNYQFLYINGPSIPSYYEDYTSNQTNLYTLPSNTSVSSYINRIFYLYDTRTAEEHYDFLLSNLLSGLLTTILLEKKNSITEAKQLPPHLQNIKNKFDTAYMESFSLEEIAREERLSKYKLAHDFTAHLGISPINYLIRVRIKNAKRLLATTNDPINEIAAAVGIDNMNHFIYLFKKSEGMTPGAYRKASFEQKRNMIE